MVAASATTLIPGFRYTAWNSPFSSMCVRAIRSRPVSCIVAVKDPRSQSSDILERTFDDFVGASLDTFPETTEQKRVYYR